MDLQCPCSLGGGSYVGDKTHEQRTPPRVSASRQNLSTGHQKCGFAFITFTIRSGSVKLLHSKGHVSPPLSPIGRGSKRIINLMIYIAK